MQIVSIWLNLREMSKNNFWKKNEKKKKKKKYYNMSSAETLIRVLSVKAFKLVAF